VTRLPQPSTSDRGAPAVRGRRLRPALLTAAALCLWLGGGGRAAAAAFSIDPTQIRLSARAASALLTVRNESAAPVRLQVSAFAWGQAAGGEMQLGATDDIVFFPALFTLAPGESRKVRVGTTAAFGPVERSYRLFVEELPGEPGTRPSGTAVQVLTRMGIPVFLQPDSPRASASLNALAAGDGVVSFRLQNTGTVHFVPDGVRLLGTDERGTAVFERAIRSWYVLAGGIREFQVTVEPPHCQQVRLVHVEVQIGDTVMRERLETPRGTCRP
jgi:fimbrial chaperone protein